MGNSAQLHKDILTVLTSQNAYSDTNIPTSDIISDILFYSIKDKKDIIDHAIQPDILQKEISKSTSNIQTKLNETKNQDNQFFIYSCISYLIAAMVCKNNNLISDFLNKIGKATPIDTEIKDAISIYATKYLDKLTKNYNLAVTKVLKLTGAYTNNVNNKDNTNKTPQATQTNNTVGKLTVYRNGTKHLVFNNVEFVIPSYADYTNNKLVGDKPGIYYHLSLYIGRGTTNRRHIVLGQPVNHIYGVVLNSYDNPDYDNQLYFNSMNSALEFGLDLAYTFGVTNNVYFYLDEAKLFASQAKSMVAIKTTCGDAFAKASIATSISEEMEEDIEKHETLNPKLFDENNRLKPEVKNKLLDIVQIFVEELEEDEINIDVADVFLTGSNANYNYTKDSDIDLHIIADTKTLRCPDNLYPKLYSAYRSIFNNKFDIDIYGIPVELYVETDDATRVSNGCYSVINDLWITEPVAKDIPDIDKTEFESKFKPWEDKYNTLIKTIDKTSLKENITPVTPYMLRNDGALLTCGEKHPYIKMYYDGSYEQNYHELFDINPQFIDWFIENSLNHETIEKLTTLKENPTEELMNELNDLTNQEFCRVRTSNFKFKYGGDNGEIYFRISSTGFNWYPLIWDTLEKDNFVKYVTIIKDTQTFGTRGFNYYKLHGQEINKMPVEEFLTASGNPIVEGISNKEKITEVEKLITDIYDQRQTGLATGNEYSIENLIFKEFRNRGYLDKLKELRHKLISKELSLENLENRT